MSLILDKYGLFDNLIYLFLGFIIGDEENFIKKKYIHNLQYLLSIGKFKNNVINADMPIYELNEKVLEILNLCLYLKEKFRKTIEENEDNDNDNEIEEEEGEEREEEKKSEKEENEDVLKRKDMLFLINSLFDNNIYKKLDLSIIYKKLEQSNDFDKIFSFTFFDEEENRKEFFIFQKKIKNLKNNIIEMIYNGKDENQDNNKIIIDNCLNIDINVYNKDLKTNENLNNTIINENIVNEKSNNIDYLKNKIHILNNENDSNSVESTSNGSEQIFSMIKLEKLNNFSNYPNLKMFEKGQNTEISVQLMYDVFQGGQMSSFIKEKINAIYNLINSSLLKFENQEKQMNLEYEIIEIKILNSRLDLLISFQNFQNLFLFKRKLIEVLIFEIFKLYKNKFFTQKNYIPKKSNLKELQDMMNNFKLKNPEDKIVYEDLKSINNLIKQFEKNKNDNSYESDEDNDDKNKNIYDDDIWQLMDFLNFYKQKLNKFVHINCNYEKYYYIPSLFNTEVKEVKFLNDIGILSDAFTNKEEYDKNSQIIKEEEIKGDIYKKYLRIDQVIDILFNNGPFINYIADNFLNELSKMKNYDKSENIKNLYHSIFNLKNCENTFARKAYRMKLLLILKKNFIMKF